MEEPEYLKGRGAQFNPANRFRKNEYVTEHLEGLDEPFLQNSKTEFFSESPKKIINKIESPDLGLSYSMNPYQGCEHGCIYCYARNTHEYWGYSAGLDFERKIIIKHNAPETLAAQLEHPKWQVLPLMLAGNTDCYQPIEQKMQLTRRMLQVLLEYRHPVSIITKNSLILRDLDILKQLDKLNLLHVNISLTTLNEELRLRLEPRTAAAAKRLSVIKILSSAGISVNVMLAPIIPGLNDHEIPEIMRQAADHGASSAAYNIVRLNGSIGDIFRNWIATNYPDRAEKVLNQIAACHGGKINDSTFGRRMTGEGQWAETIGNLFRVAKQKYMQGRQMKPYNYHLFCTKAGKQLNLF
ncbi:PA0069 family radical SAM protein [Adhaeribacter radiodurans]|uniref:PA0069 family radical SAM protein n=1 Tax=Adhaeribacter radiodurans TaxID=2745197 RepID=A0A7L7L949_9BACT|nr:PA0069 family radical SAM protein [Adhaeribacter radiodurans]QMU28919.1 PA0069 family radical SAM protein [Adhaeribacter radiodurans]